MAESQYDKSSQAANEATAASNARQIAIDKEKLDALNATVQSSKLPEWAKQGFMVVVILAGVFGLIKTNEPTPPAPQPIVVTPINTPVGPAPVTPVKPDGNDLIIIPGKASASLKPPVTGMVGEPLIFDCTGTVGVFAWHYNANQTTPEQMMVFEDQGGRLIIIPKVSCTINVVLFAYNDADHSHDVKFASVFVANKPDGGSVTPVTPNTPVKPVTPVTPVGPLGPKPSFDKGRYDFASVSYDLAVTVEAAHRALAPKLGIAIAGEVEAIAAEIAAGSPVSLPEAKSRIQMVNREVLTAEHVPAWTDFVTQWSNKTDALNKDKTLKSLDDYLELWSETSVGLQAVK